MNRFALTLAALLVVAPAIAAQGLSDLSQGVVDRYVSVGAENIVIRNVTVVDGTGAEARRGQSVHIQDGRIAAMGDRVIAPDDATVIDGTGKLMIRSRTNRFYVQQSTVAIPGR